MSDEPRASRRDVVATLLILGAFAAIAGGRPLIRKLSRHPSEERCAAMLDRYAAQVARAYERAPGPQPVGALDVTRCTRELTDAEVECALNAGYADELERCLPP